MEREYNKIYTRKYKEEIRGFHTLWTAPYFTQNTNNLNGTYDMQDYELLTMIMSALMWRRMNGSITLYGDKKAIDYVEKKGVAHIWDGGIEEIDVPDRISPRVFWAAGKLYALRSACMPEVMVDLDLIVWKNIGSYIKETDISAIHREGIYPEVYPGRDFFNMREGYEFDPDWNWDAPPVNTCMLYIADEQFKKYYVDSSIDFMENCIETEENLCHMVFAEQRLLAMCAGKKEKRIASFFPEAADIDRQDVFTHLWGYKNILRFNFQKRVEYNRRLCERIERDFPEEAYILGELNVCR